VNYEDEMIVRAFLRNASMVRRFDELTSKVHEGLRTKYLAARSAAKADFDRTALEDPDLFDAMQWAEEDLQVFLDMCSVYSALSSFAREHFDREICPGGCLTNP